MNRIFRVIWSTALGAWVVASELAVRHGKRGGTDKRRNALDVADRIHMSTHSPMALRLGVLTALFALYTPAHAQSTTLYWDVNGTGVGTGGTGTWDLSTPYWNSASDGVTGPMVAWNNASIGTAIFGGTAGTVTLGTSITANALTFNTNGYTLNGSTLTLAGTTPTITVSTGTTTINSVIAGTAGLTKSGASSLTLSGANTFSGGITLNAGTLNASNDAALGNSANGITMANGTTLTGGSAFNASRVITVQSGMASIQGGALSARITGAGGVNAAGTLSNNANNYTGQTRGQFFSFTSVADLGTASALGAPTDPTTGTILATAGGGLGSTVTYTGSGNQSNRNWQFNNTTSGGNTLVNSGTGALMLTGNILAAGGNWVQMSFNASSADMSLLGQISAATGRQIVFTGGTGRTITLGGANTYDGITSISGITVKASTLANSGSNSSFGTGASGGINITSGVLSYTGAAASSNFPLSIAGASTISNDGTGPLSLTGATTVNTSAALTLGGSFTGINTLSGVVSGSGSLTVNGAGTWVLGGSNTYTGTTTVQNGTLMAGSTQAFAGSSSLVVNGGTLDLNNLAITAPSLAGTGGTVNLGSGSLTLNASAGSTSYAGIITGSGSLTKSGTSSLSLSGANSYTGATTVGGGTLTLNFTAAGAPASNIISSASTLNMSGGTLAVNGKASASTSQSFNGLTVLAGSNKIVATAGTGGTLTLGLGAISQSGGLADFDFNSGATITTSNANGALGGWATVNGTDYAQVSGGVITALTNYANKDDASTWINGDIVSDAGGAANTAYFNTVSGSVALGGLKYTAAANSTVTVGSGNTLGVGGNILVTSTAGSASQTIQGGSLTGGANGGPLGVLQNSAGTFTIASTIVDNGAPTSFSVGGSGTGTVSLTGANTYTGPTTVSGGTLAFNSIANGGSASAIGASTNASSNLVLQSGNLRYTGATASTDRGFTLQNGGPSRTIQVDGASNLTFSGVVTSPDSSGLNVTGTGTLTLANASNNFVGPITISGGTLAATTLANGGQVSSIGAASNASSNLVLQNSGTLAYTGATVSIDRGFTLGNGTAGNVGQVSVSQAGTTLTDSGTVIGNGALVKGGAGTLVLSGTNTYSGGTAVNAGTLRAGSSLAFGGAANGAGAGQMTVASGATLDLAGNSVWVGGLNGGGGVTLGTGTLQINNSGTFTGNISGTGGVTLGAGAQTFSGCGNTYTGPTTIGGGILYTDCLANGGQASGVGASSSASSNLQIGNGAALYYTGTSVATDRGVTLSGGNDSVGVTNAATTLTVGGQVTGSGALIKYGAGILIFTGTTNNYTGGTSIQQGTLRAGATNAFGTSGAGGLTIANVAGATLDLNGFDTTVVGLSGGGSTGGAVQLTNKTLTLSSGGGWTFAGAINGTGNLIKNGAATQFLSGCASTYTGITTINAGVLSVDCLTNGGIASAIGAASNAASNLVLNGGTLQYTGAGGTTDHQLTLGPSATSALDASGTGAVQYTNTAALAFSSANTAQTVTLTGTNTGNNSLAAQITDNVTGKSSVSKAGTGTWILNNTGSNYTGVTTIAGGVLGVSKLSNGGQASSIGSSSNIASNLVIGSGSTLLYTGSGDTTDRLFTLSTGVSFISSSGTGAVVFSNTGSASYLSSGNRTLALGGTNTGLNTMGGTIINGPGGVTTLAKNDAGTWALTGNNSYTGNTVINDGNLMIGNGGSTGNAGAGNVIVYAPTSTLSFNRNNTFNFTGTLSGPGTIAQIGTGTTVLTSASNSIGNTTVSAGTLQVNGGLTSGGVTVGAAALQVQAGGTLTTPTIAMNAGSALTVNGTVAAAGNAATTFSGTTGPSTISVNSGGTLIGNGTLGSGGGNLVDIAGTLNTGGGTLNLGTGNDTLLLDDGGTVNGIVDGGSGGESGGGDALQVIANANRTLNTASVIGFETLLKQGTGTLTLTGTQSYSAGTLVQTGTLLVDGNQAGTGGLTTVQSGATLGGTGTIAGDVTVASGAALNPGDTGAVGALTVNGNLTLNNGAALNYQFGQANVPGGALNDLTTVHGNLTLGGALNINTAPSGSFTPGVYRILSYDGALTNNGLTIGSAPAGTYYLQTSVANQVNLVNSTGLTLNFWDGPGHQNDSTIQGGNGLWQNATGNDNWTDQTGKLNAPYTDAAFAIFGGTAGTVTIDNSLGNVRASGMQFTVSGYTINGDPLTLAGAPSIIRVGDGTSAGANMTATINAALTGTGGLQKSDLGTLVLSGTNTYTGGTTVNGGTLQISGDSNLGDATGALTLDGGTLRNTAAFTSARVVALNTNGGTFDTQANLTLSGVIGGTGALTKIGNGTLTLAGSNSYAGGTSINGGTVSVSSDANLGNASGALSFNGGTLQNTATFVSSRGITLNAGGGTFQTTSDLTLSGAIGGTGALTKADAGTLMLTANNTYAGGTTIAAGALQLGNGGAAGSITGNVIDNGTLAFDRSDTYNFGGVISGSGAVTQRGTGITVLSGTNTYTGATTVQAGTLVIDGDQSSATGLATVQSGATLGGTGIVGGDVTVANGGTLNPGDVGSVPGTLTINGNLSLGNASTLSYNFGQANVVGGAYNDLTKVGGNLTLDGTINVSVSAGGSFDPGIYRIISYAGALTDNGLTVGTMPSPNFYLQTSVANQVNLVNTAGLAVNFWDGNGARADGVVEGGSGVWQNGSGNDNWTLIDGSTNAPYQNGTFSIFTGAAGVVNVDSSLGAVTSSGMQFAIDGYTIQGDPITLTNPSSIIRVGDGTSDGAGMTATIASPLIGSGGLQKTDLGTLVLTGANTYSGGTTITAGTLQLGNGGTSGSIVGAVVDDSALVFNRSDSVAFGGAISGGGSVTHAGNGTTTLTGNNTYAGATNVQAGTLLVDGNQSGASGLTTAQGGATLGGTGTIGGDVTIANGGALSPGDAGSAGTLTINGNLSLNSGSVLTYQFGQAGVAGGALNDQTVVHGNLALAGTLNVSATPGGAFGPGVYRVISYDGTLTDNGLVLGTVPAGNLYVQTSVAHQVNLVDSTGLALNFWDGPNGHANDGVVTGGNGAWRLADNDDWTEAAGALNAPYSNGAFAVFTGSPGTVIIDNGNGQVQASGLQFEVDGYRLTGGTLELTGSTPTIRVGDGTAAGANMTATIDAVLVGSGTLVKDDLGTLVLDGTNTFTGGTTIHAGTVQVASDANLGAATGALTLGNGTLHTTASFQTDRAVALTGNGTFQTDDGTTLTLGKAITGTGSLAKTGTGMLVLGAASTYSGATTVNAGTLQAAVANAFSASSAFTTATNSTLDLAGFSQTVASLSNAGAVHFGSTPGTALTVQGDYVGQGGVLNFNTVLGDDSSATDQLIVRGSTSGNTVVHVTNVGGVGAPTAQGIKLIDVQGASNGSFALAGNYVFQGQQAVVAGAYAYRLYQGGASTPADGDWYLRSALVNPSSGGGGNQGGGNDGGGDPPPPLYQPGVPLYEAYAGVLRQIDTLDSLYERVGDRTWTGNAPAGGSMGPGEGVWVRVQGADQTYKPEITTSGTDYDISTWKGEAGLDAKLGDTAGGTLVAGAALQVGRYQTNVASLYGMGRIKTNSYGFNTTLTWYGDSGLYVDGQWRWTRFDSDLYSTTARQVLKNSNHGSGYAIGVEAGQRFHLGETWSLIPQAQVNYGRAAFNGFNDAYGAYVSVQQGRDLVGRAGMAVDYRSTWQGAAGPLDSHLYAIINLYRDFEGATRVDVSGANLSSRNERLWGGVGVGGSLDWGNGRYSVYGEVQGKTGLSHFGDSHEATGTLGFRMKW